MLLHPAVDTHLVFAVRTVVENVLHGINTEWNQTTAKPTTTVKTTKKNTLEFSINYYTGTKETFQATENCSENYSNGPLDGLSNVLQGSPWEVVVYQIIYLKRKTPYAQNLPSNSCKTPKFGKTGYT